MTNIPALPPLTPKSHLLGKTLNSGWKLVEKLEQTVNSSGGTFGVGYKATRDNEIAFVKAIDFVEALSAPDPLSRIGELAAVANFERDVLEYCAARGMTKILRYIGHEYISADDSQNPISRVSCLIMEAGTEDLRRLVSSSRRNSCAWNLQVMHDVSLAVAQLHLGGIAHQDIKPSNVISFVNRDPKLPQTMKVGDLGRVVRRAIGGPFDSLPWPGDSRYSPPERWYGFVPPDWSDARDASDAYMLGSLLVYLFTQTTLQSLVLNYIPDAFRPGKWAGRFDENLLPVLIDAHARALADYLLPQLMPEMSDSILAVARELTHPDPMLRGDKRARRQIGRPVGIDRIHQKFKEISYRCAAIERVRGQQ